MMSTHCAAIEASLEVTFGAKLAQDVLKNLSQGCYSIALGISTGNPEKTREGYRALGDAGIDTAQLAYLGKLIEGWAPPKVKPTASTPQNRNARS
jgi:hypothetical protein